MTPVTERLEDRRQKAGLTVSELSRWIGVNHATLYYWLNGGHDPMPYKTALLQERLTWLEEAMRDDRLPVPQAHTLGRRARRDYLERLKQYYEKGREPPSLFAPCPPA